MSDSSGRTSIILSSREIIFGGGERFLELIAPVLTKRGYYVSLRCPKMAILRSSFPPGSMISRISWSWNRIVIANDFRSLWLSLILDRRAHRIFVVHGKWQISKLRMYICFVFKIPIATVSNELRIDILNYFPRIACVVLKLGPAAIERNDGTHKRKDGQKNARNLVIGTIARLDPVKNIPLFVRVVDEFHLENKEVRGIILTNKPNSDAEFGIFNLISANCDIHQGFEVEGFFSKIDIFLSTSFTESLGLSHLEALSFGVPVVSTAIGGPSEVLVGSLRCGYIPGEAHEREIMRAIMETLKVSAMPEYWSEASRLLASRNPSEMVDQLEGLWK